MKFEEYLQDLDNLSLAEKVVDNYKEDELKQDLQDENYFKIVETMYQNYIQELEDDFFINYEPVYDGPKVEANFNQNESSIKVADGAFYYKGEEEPLSEEEHVDEVVHEEQKEEIKNDEQKPKKKQHFFLRNLFSLIIILLTSYILGYFFFGYIINLNVNKYEVTYESSMITESDIDYAFFEEALRKYKMDENKNYILDENGNKIIDSYSYKSVFDGLTKMFEKEHIELDDNKITIRAKYFINTQGATTSKESYERFQKVLTKVLTFHDKQVKVEYQNINYFSPWIYALTFLSLGLLFDIIYMIIYIKKHKDEEIKDDGLFVHPFSKKYWQSAIQKFTKIKVFDVVLLAILLSLILVCKFIPIPSGFAGLGLGLTYLVLALACLVYGPIWALLIGAYSDILGFIISPTVFLFEYTLQAMVTCFIYGLMFYRRKFSFMSCLITRIIINIFINGIWGSYLFIYRYQGQTNPQAFYDYMFYLALPKNIIYLIPQTILLYLVLRALIPIFKRNDLVPKAM